MRTFAQKPKATHQTKSVKSTHPSRALSGQSRDMHSILQLQRTIGNQAVQLLLLSNIVQNKCVQKSTDAAPAAPPVVNGGLVVAGQPRNMTTRTFMESRFGHDFGAVRVHTASPADAAARSMCALAGTRGEDIVFGEGQFAPNTGKGKDLLAHDLAHVVQRCSQAVTPQLQVRVVDADEHLVSYSAEGRHLLSHELSPVIQQRNISRPGSLIIQRQSQQNPTRQRRQSPPVKRKTLHAAGVGLKDPVSKKTARIIDEVLQRNRKLVPYIGDRIKSGFRIAEKGKFVQEPTDNIFNDAYRKAYGLGPSKPVPSHILGFFDPGKSKIHLRPGSEFGTALHEAVHRLASPVLYSIYLPVARKFSRNLTKVLSEGVTAYFTDSVLKDEGLSNFNDANRSLKRKAGKLVTDLGSGGFGLMAKFNFKGDIVEIGEKLGISRRQYINLKGTAIKEVLKRIAKIVK